MIESSLEKAFIAACNVGGFECHKLSGNGEPDRLIVRKSRAAYVELKQSEGRLRPAQLARMRELVDAGAHYYVLRPHNIQRGCGDVVRTRDENEPLAAWLRRALDAVEHFLVWGASR